MLRQKQNLKHKVEKEKRKRRQVQLLIIEKPIIDESDNENKMKKQLSIISNANGNTKLLLAFKTLKPVKRLT